MTNIAIVYYSATGNIAAMANAIGEGAASVGAEVRVRRVAGRVPGWRGGLRRRGCRGG